MTPNIHRWRRRELTYRHSIEGCGVALLVALVSACGDSSPRVVSARERGQELLEAPSVSGSAANRLSCATCHRQTPQERPELILPGALLAGATQRGQFWNGNELSLLTSINRCRFFFMGARTDWTASDSDAKYVYSALEFLSVAASAEAKASQPFTVVTDVSDLPGIGDAAKGSILYRNACASCHGAASTGEGRLTERAVRLPDETIASHVQLGSKVATRAVFIEKVRHGTFLGYTGIMPPFSREVLGDDQLRDLLTFLKQY
jgi:thiosulfate dehydrogenase